MKINQRALFVMFALLAAGQRVTAEDRIRTPIDPAKRVVLRGEVHPRAQVQFDRGKVEPVMVLNSITILLIPAASLSGFLIRQQTPSSPEYHHSLSPEQFADQFGLSRKDIATITSWLESQDLTVNEIARGRNWITFTGSAEKVAQAFHTEIHYYDLDGKRHFANAFPPDIPAAFEGVVGGFSGLNDIGIEAPHLLTTTPSYTSGNTHYLAPDDLATIYDIAPLYTGGIDGTGQKVVVVGTSQIALQDIRSFRQTFNLPAADPQVILVGPDPGTNSTLTEAELDIEWAGAVARNASILYVYSQNVVTAAQYAIDQNLAPVLNMSFSGCESATSTAVRYLAQQANAQGITWVASSGDSGPAECDRSSPVPEASKGPTVSSPASYPEVTGVGGTNFNEQSGIYWNAANNGNHASVLSYIPEVVWNDSAATNTLAASGGGPSAFFDKPPWQSGPGVPNDGVRDVPDIALAASPDHDPHLVVISGNVLAIGGTSSAAPVFSGVVALLNQFSSAETGQGNINPRLYALARTTSDVFHDVVSGDNKVPCEQSSPGCTDGELGFPAGPGYDLATGLGSLDVYRLVTEWGNTGAPTTTSLASVGQIHLSDTVQLVATIAPASGNSGSAPTGTVVFLADDATIGSATVMSSGGNATATLTVSGVVIASGSSVWALYTGDAVFAASSGSTPVVLVPSSGSLVVPSVTPNPVNELLGSWPVMLTLTEKAGISTTITSITIGGQHYPPNLLGTALIPANGTLSLTFSPPVVNPPTDQVFSFSGMDANGLSWTQQLTVSFLPATRSQLTPGIALTGAPGTVVQNPQADPSCQWSQNLIVQEQGGFSTVLTNLQVDTLDLTDQIQTLFGTTRLAPFGTLLANVCFANANPPSTQTLSLSGISGTGTATTPVTATLSATLAGAVPNAANLSVSPSALTIQADSSSGLPSVALSFDQGSPQWTASVLLANQAATWLAVLPASGNGATTLKLQASTTGLSNGAYRAILLIQSMKSNPQSVVVPIMLVVGNSSAMSIAGVGNAFSGSTGFAPGELVSIYGQNLAPSPMSAQGAPLPLRMAGVWVTVNGISAPIKDIVPAGPGVSQDQLNVQIPYETGTGDAILAVNNGGQVAAFSLPMSVTAPGLYGAAVDAITGQPVTSVQLGQALLLFMTGEGDVTPTLATGATPLQQSNPANLPHPGLPLVVTIGGVPAAVQFAGIPPGLVGVSQINVTVAPNTPSGSQQVIVTVGGVATNAITLNVTPSQ
jgi:uncharacterized protein (TIGR03437 family)